LIERYRRSFNYLKKGSNIIGTGKLRRRISTGSLSLDKIIGGGISTGRITELFGESGVGKSQICFQLCVNALIKDSNFDKVLFMDTSGTFRPERIKDMVTENERIESILNNILVINVRSSKEQMNILGDIENSKSLANIKLLIIDNLTDNFIFDFQGNDTIGERQHFLARHLNEIASLSIEQDIAVVVTNTVRTRINKVSNRNLEGTGGNTVSQSIHIILQLVKLSDSWLAHRIDTNRTARFKIAKKGIMDG
jgi:DNA repair protein RadA